MVDFAWCLTETSEILQPHFSQRYVLTSNTIKMICGGTTRIWRLLLWRSGSAHCNLELGLEARYNLELALEVRQCLAFAVEACDREVAVGCAHCNLALAVEAR